MGDDTGAEGSASAAACGVPYIDDRVDSLIFVKNLVSRRTDFRPQNVAVASDTAQGDAMKVKTNVKAGLKTRH